MKNRKNISSGTEWEQKVNYSRLVKVGNMIFVSGTTAVDAENNIIGKDNAYEQAKYIFQKIAFNLREVDAGLNNVVRTRMFVTNIDDWEAVGKAHAEFFDMINPAATMVEVSKLIHPDLLVEIEVDAVVTEKNFLSR